MIALHCNASTKYKKYKNYIMKTILPPLTQLSSPTPATTENFNFRASTILPIPYPFPLSKTFLRQNGREKFSYIPGA
jgi:hypothetical protein